MYEHNDYNDEIFDGLGPEDQALADLLRRARFAPTPVYQANLWKKLKYNQSQQSERNSKMSLSSWTNLFSKALRLGLTAAVSATVVAIIVLAGTLIVSPDVRAQVQQLMIRFVEVDSPEDFLAEQIREQQAALEAKKDSVAPADDVAASPKGEESTQKTDTVESTDTRDLPSLPDAGSGLRDIESRPDDIPLPTLQSSARPDSPGLISLEEAQSRTSFTIRTPTWLPEGYNLQGVMVPPDLSSNFKDLPQPDDAPKLSAPVVATLNFSNEAGDVLRLSEMRRPQLEDRTEFSSREILLPLPKDKGSVQEVTINGQPGQYIEMGPGRQLHWQDADGLTYDLFSTTLDQATLIRIAESVN